jgi:hypothetical protein
MNSKRTYIHTYITSILFLFLLAVFGCSLDGDDNTGLGDKSGEESIEVLVKRIGVGQAWIPEDTAVRIAEEWLKVVRASETGSGWTDASEVTEAFPVKTPGIDGVSYYECKVMTSGQDSGYILVNINKTDMRIPEFTDEGITSTERFEAELGRSDFDVYRFDWFSYAAAARTDGSDGDRTLWNRILVETGEYGSEQVDDYLDAVDEKGCMPYYEVEEIARHNDCDQVQEILPRSSYPDPSGADVSGLLSHSTILWDQPLIDIYWVSYRDDPAYVGCGPTAWAVVYEYWQQHRGKSNLFHGDDVSLLTYPVQEQSDFDPVKACMIEIAQLTGTEYSHIESSLWGRTWPWDMDMGIFHAFFCGYPASTVVKENGSENSKFLEIVDDIRDDKPVILQIDSSGVGLPTHYVVIEEAYKQYQSGHIEWIWYYVNYCWGGDGNKYIVTYDYGTNQYPLYTSAAAFLITVR